MEIILSDDAKEEISTLLRVLDFKPDCGMVRIEDIIKAEREACAQIAGNWRDEASNGFYASREIAKRIRQRGE